MTPTLLTLTLVLLLPGDAPTRSEGTRKPHPFAPSLPLLTDAEEAKIDEIIDRYIQFDLGKLQGEDAKRAQQDFNKLGPEAIPALIRGINKAANIQASCPAVVIAKKLGGMLLASTDGQLLDFARENIGAGVTLSQHMGLLRDLKVALMLRKRAMSQNQRVNAGKPTVIKPARSMTNDELTEAAGSERGLRLKTVLTELEQRNGGGVLDTLVAVASFGSEKDNQQVARELLVRNLSRLSDAEIKKKLKDERAEVRAAAAKVAGNKVLRFGTELIDLLKDNEEVVRQAARQALVRLSRGADFGPKPDASEADRAKAHSQWRQWWDKQDSR